MIDLDCEIHDYLIFVDWNLRVEFILLILNKHVYFLLYWFIKRNEKKCLIKTCSMVNILLGYEYCVFDESPDYLKITLIHCESFGHINMKYI